MTLNVIGDGQLNVGHMQGSKNPVFKNPNPVVFLGFIGLWVLSVFFYFNVQWKKTWLKSEN